MSRIGARAIDVPENVEVSVEGKTVKTVGPKGELKFRLPAGIEVKAEEGKVVVERKRNSKQARSLHGTVNRVIRNNLKGVSEGWGKTLELVGTGYRARLEESTLTLSVGYSHPVKVEAPEGISFSVEENRIIVSGADKVLVGQVAANIRDIRPPEPYKGKGIKYIDETVRRKAGKATKVGVGA